MLVLENEPKVVVTFLEYVFTNMSEQEKPGETPNKKIDDSV